MKLSPWHGDLEKLTVPQLVKKFPAIYGNMSFIAPFTTARNQNLSWARSIQYTTPYSISSKTHFNIMLPPTQKPSNSYVSVDDVNKTFYTFLLSPHICTCPACQILFVWSREKKKKKLVILLYSNISNNQRLQKFSRNKSSWVAQSTWQHVTHFLATSVSISIDCSFSDWVSNILSALSAIVVTQSFTEAVSTKQIVTSKENTSALVHSVFLKPDIVCTDTSRPRRRLDHYVAE